MFSSVPPEGVGKEDFTSVLLVQRSVPPVGVGADADEGVTLTGSKADDVVVTRTTTLVLKMSRSPPPLVTIPATFRSWTLPSGADVAPPGA